jgi:2-polyprenyl-3-methyl-5-hydroxy-6-metoxy-1,4-benzoquinol methylase
MGACNLCGGVEWRTLEAAGPTRVVRCRCGLVFLTPQPARERLEAAYDAGYYEAWGAQTRLRERLWRERLRTVAALRPPPGRLLDVGCGEGSFLREAARQGWTATGTEFSPSGAERARAAGVPVLTGELHEVGLPAESFEVITCWHVIEHVSDPRRLLGEMYHLLAPGGVLVLATPNLDDRMFRTAYLLGRRRRPRLYEPDEREVHLFVFSARTVRRLAAAEGFTDIRVGFDRGASAVRSKRAVDALAYGWYRLTGIHWGMALEVTAKKARLQDEVDAASARA